MDLPRTLRDARKRGKSSHDQSSHDRESVIRRCAEGEVPCGPVCSIEDVFNEERFRVRDTLVRVTDPRIGRITPQGTIPKLSGTPGGIRHLGATLAAHNEAIYAGEPGLGREEMAELSDAGVIWVTCGCVTMASNRGHPDAASQGGGDRWPNPNRT